MIKFNLSLYFIEFALDFIYEILVFKIKFLKTVLFLND